MLEPTEIQNLTSIVDVAVNKLFSEGYSQFLLKSVSWRDDEGFWIVEFYCEVGTHEIAAVAVKPILDRFISKGFWWEFSDRD